MRKTAGRDSTELQCSLGRMAAGEEGGEGVSGGGSCRPQGLAHRVSAE